MLVTTVMRTRLNLTMLDLDTAYLRVLQTLTNLGENWDYSYRDGSQRRGGNNAQCSGWSDATIAGPIFLVPSIQAVRIGKIIYTRCFSLSEKGDL